MAKYISSCFGKAAVSLNLYSPIRRRTVSRLMLPWYTYRVTHTHDGKTAGRMEKTDTGENMSLLNTERILLYILT
jgi:hypothetical protein